MVEINNEHLKIQQLDPCEEFPEELNKLLIRVYQADQKLAGTDTDLETFLAITKIKLQKGDIYTAGYKETMLGVMALYLNHAGAQHPYFSRADIAKISPLYLCQMTNPDIIANALIEATERFLKYLGKRSLAILLSTNDQIQKQYFEKQGFIPTTIEAAGELPHNILMVKNLRVKKHLEVML